MKILMFNKSSLTFFLCFFTVGLFLVLLKDPVYSQTEVLDKTPLHVVSDKMISQQDTSMVEFIGNVKVTRLDSIVLADSIKIYFVGKDKNKSDQGNAQSNVEKIVSEGNVEYTAGDRKAFADKAVFTMKDEILVLTGNAPKLITGSSFVTGKKITFYRKQDKVIVESDGVKRVEALFNPEDNVTRKQ